MYCGTRYKTSLVINILQFGRRVLSKHRCFCRLQNLYLLKRELYTLVLVEYVRAKVDAHHGEFASVV